MMQKLKIVMLLVAGLLFATSCHDYFDSTSPEVDIEQSKKGKKSVTVSEDDDSDRPPWAGGNTDANTHSKGNDDSGTMRGGDYGDLFILSRDVDNDGNMEYFVTPIDAGGNIIVLDQYGELPENAPVVEVEFGRLNIVRSPQSVIDQALREVITAMNQGNRFTQDFCGRLSIWQDEILLKTIDSPRESMAMYQEIMNNGFGHQLAALNDFEISPLDLAAASFSAGSDKTGTVDIDEVVYINGFMDCVGDLPIVHAEENDKEYFDFGNFSYSRQNTYTNRFLQFYNYVDGEYIPDGDPVSVLDAMEDRGLFSERNIGEKSNVDGFAWAIDDAVQVLEFVHGNSNIAFLPDYVPL